VGHFWRSRGYIFRTKTSASKNLHFVERSYRPSVVWCCQSMPIGLCLSMLIKTATRTETFFCKLKDQLRYKLGYACSCAVITDGFNI
jgi:hypothetical protein